MAPYYGRASGKCALLVICLNRLRENDFMDTSLLSSMYDEDGRDISALIEEMEEDSYEDHIR